MSWKKSETLMDTIKHNSSFPATGVSLRQMVQFGEKPSVGMSDPFRAVDRMHWNIELFLTIDVAAQAPSSVPLSSLLKSFPFALHTESRSWMNYQTGSTRCRPSRESRTGTPSLSRCATLTLRATLPIDE